MVDELMGPTSRLDTTPRLDADPPPYSGPLSYLSTLLLRVQRQRNKRESVHRRSSIWVDRMDRLDTPRKPGLFCPERLDTRWPSAPPGVGHLPGAAALAPTLPPTRSSPASRGQPQRGRTTRSSGRSQEAPGMSGRGRRSIGSGEHLMGGAVQYAIAPPTTARWPMPSTSRSCRRPPSRPTLRSTDGCKPL